MEENSLADLDHDDDDDDDDVAGASRPAWSARWPDSCAAPADLSKDRIPALASEEHRLHKDHIASAPRLLVCSTTKLRRVGRLGPAGVRCCGQHFPRKVSEMFWFCGAGRRFPYPLGEELASGVGEAPEGKERGERETEREREREREREEEVQTK